MRVTDLCGCGHRLMAHSPANGCVYCRCNKRYSFPAEQVIAAQDRTNAAAAELRRIGVDEFEDGR